MLSFIGLRAIHQRIETLFLINGDESSLGFFAKQFFLFGYLQAVSCIFPVLIFISLGVSMLFANGIPRYDVLLLICVVAQMVMYKTGMETRDEVYVITLFHVLGLVMEIHKVHRGSWSYPEDAFTKFYGVPLYAGFMYASVGSYICQAWRNLELKVDRWPSTLAASVCGMAIYFNFFTNAFIPDLRLYIAICLIIVFRKTRFTFRLNSFSYKIHALLSFVIIGFFIWLAENIATFLGAWKYAYQHAGWKMVTWHKITSWSLLVIVSIIIVGELKKLKLSRTAAPENA